MSMKSASADGRTPVPEAPDTSRSDGGFRAVEGGGIEAGRFREVAELVDSEFNRYWKMRESLRARFSKFRRSVVAKNPN